MYTGGILVRHVWRENFGSSPIQGEHVELDIKRSRHSLNKRRRPIIRDSNGFMLPVMGTGDRSKRDAVLSDRSKTLLSFRVGDSLFLLRIRAR